MVAFRVANDGVTSSATTGPRGSAGCASSGRESVSNEIFPLDDQSTRLLAYYSGQRG